MNKILISSLSISFLFTSCSQSTGRDVESSAATVTTSNSGTLSKTFGSYGITTSSERSGYDYGRKIIEDSSGNFYACGSASNGSDMDMALWKFDSAGDAYTSFGTNGIVVHHSAAGGDADDYALSCVIDSSDNIYLTGYSYNGSNYDMAVWKYNENGSLDTSFGSSGIFTHHNAAGGYGNDEGHDIALDSDGNLVIAGSSVNADTNTDMALWKISSSGSLVTDFNSVGYTTHNDAAGGDANDQAHALVLDSDHSIYVTGESYNNSDLDMVIWKYTSEGELDSDFGNSGVVVEDGTAGGYDNDIGYAITINSYGGEEALYIAGSSINNDENSDLMVWKYDLDGEENPYFGYAGFMYFDALIDDDIIGHDYGYGILVDDNGGIYVTGKTQNESDYEMVIVKLDQDGELDDSFSYDGIVYNDSAAGGNDDDLGYSLYLNDDNELFVVGASKNDDDYDMAIWKYE